MLVVKTGMTSEAATAKAIVSSDALVLTGVMTVADFQAQVPTDCEAIISYGLCGGLAPGISIAALLVANKLATDNGDYTPDQDWAQRLVVTTAAKPVMWFSSGQFNLADTPVQRAALFAQTGAKAIDDESATMAEFAKQRGVPFAIMRTVSDDWEDTVPQAAYNALNPDGSSDINSIIAYLKANPSTAAGQVFDLAAIAVWSEEALGALQAAGQGAGPDFQYNTQ